MNQLPDFTKLKELFDSDAFPSGARAELRRAATPNDTALTPALYRLFPGQKPDDRHLRLAFLLPHVRHATKAKSLGAQFVNKRVSEARILQVARSKAPLDIIQMRRLLAHVNPVLDWSEFGRMVWFWNDISKRQFVEDFYIAQFNPSQGEKK